MRIRTVAKYLLADLEPGLKAILLVSDPEKGDASRIPVVAGTPQVKYRG